MCCGTKRLVEINCPADCPHLASAQAHPAAVVRRQQEDDLAMFIPTVRDLTPAQEDLMSRLLMFLRQYRSDGLLRVTDADVQAATAALASTFETASRGLIYEERPGSLSAQRLAADLKAVIEDIVKNVGSSAERHVATVLRAIERGARDAGTTLPGGNMAYLELLRRLIVPGTPAATERPQPGSGLIQPGGSLLVRP
jgi:hypothetical protein